MVQAQRRVPTGERAERKRAAIVAAAREVFLREGFDAGMDLIATEAGVSKVTVYNHFGSKEALFTEIVGDALDQALGQTTALAEERLTSSANIRDALISTAHGWVSGMTQPEMLALRNLVAGESRRFPELGRAWQQAGPDRARPILIDALQRLVDQRALRIPDLDLAIVQFYALVLYPHFVYSMYGSRIDERTTDELITTGVDMFLGYYGTGRRARRS